MTRMNVSWLVGGTNQARCGSSFALVSLMSQQQQLRPPVSIAKISLGLILNEQFFLLHPVNMQKKSWTIF